MAKPEPSEIEYKGMKFLVTDRPSDLSMDKYIEELRKHNASDVVRVCDPTYSVKRLKSAGIAVSDMQFDDGTGPPQEIIDQFFELIRIRFTDDPGCCIAVHCVAGLGRAPVLVAIALIEAGMRYEDAVELIRHEPKASKSNHQSKHQARSRPEVQTGGRHHQPPTSSRQADNSSTTKFSQVDADKLWTEGVSREKMIAKDWDRNWSFMCEVDPQERAIERRRPANNDVTNDDYDDVIFPPSVGRTSSQLIGACLTSQDGRRIQQYEFRFNAVNRRRPIDKEIMPR